MKKEYYTPTIEEFHVGFEFMFKDVFSEWMADKMDVNHWDTLQKDISTGSIKVERLDRESIESFDFKYDEAYKEHVEKKHGTAIYHKDVEHRGESKKLMLIHNKVSHWVLLSLSQGSPSYGAEIRHEEKGIVVEIAPINTIFAGTVNNKSELKRVLMQTKLISGE